LVTALAQTNHPHIIVFRIRFNIISPFTHSFPKWFLASIFLPELYMNLSCMQCVLHALSTSSFIPSF
jgi:hypothetical protein